MPCVRLLYALGVSVMHQSLHTSCPYAATLSLALQTVSGQLIRNTPTEELLWSYTVQLAAILRAAHASGLALRPAALSATKVRGWAQGPQVVNPSACKLFCMQSSNSRSRRTAASTLC
eukprot:GHUV01050297.1.p2 GENE.GHUV01050297.1~~GHUV01050297.1.p2  ORF type:complete len:118 (-),score=23.60 GHUV01050297.1:382-735(-)